MQTTLHATPTIIIFSSPSSTQRAWKICGTPLYYLFGQCCCCRCDAVVVGALAFFSFVHVNLKMCFPSLPFPSLPFPSLPFEPIHLLWQAPIYGTQWHPERPQFEWILNEGLPHDPATVEVRVYLSHKLACVCVTWVFRNTMTHHYAYYASAACACVCLPLTRYPHFVFFFVYYYFVFPPFSFLVLFYFLLHLYPIARFCV